LAEFQPFSSDFARCAQPGNRFKNTAKEPFKNNHYIFAILPDVFVFAGSLHTFRYAPLRQFTKSLRDISQNL